MTKYDYFWLCMTMFDYGKEGKIGKIGKTGKIEKRGYSWKKRETKGNRRKIQLIWKTEESRKIMNMGENCCENRKNKNKGERQNKGTK